MELSAKTASELIHQIPKLAGKKIMIVGDLGVDEYVQGEVKRISPEAPVPVLDVQSEDQRLGLSANVAQNISALGGVPLLVSVVGKDSTAELLADLLKKHKISPEFLISDTTRPTTRKLRVMAAHHHIVRVDYEHRRFLESAVEDRLLKLVDDKMSEVDGVILQDYAKGVISERVAHEVIRLARAQKKHVVVDPYKSSPLSLYRGASLMTPNHDESVSLAGFVMDGLRSDKDYINKVGRRLMEGIASDQMVITLGKNGMRLFDRGGTFDLPTFARQVFDVTGAGDTVIAVLTLAWSAGLSLPVACQLANYAAGVVVGKVGCVPCTKEELESYIRENQAQ